MIPVIAVDGPSGSGKGTVCRLVARALGWHLLDSGALYRLVALAGDRAGLDASDQAGHAALAGSLDIRFEVDEAGTERVLLDGEDITRELRSEKAGNAASRVAAWPDVRKALFQRQRRFMQAPGLVADGRDMGSVVFRDAGLKIFLTASAEERARRRHKQLKEKGLGVNLAALSAEISERDRRDATREVAPLVACEDAVVIDSTALDIDAVVERVLELARDRFLGPRHEG
ncbi:MAG TPA: (d)CMP kinase [Steroidobacteraceae bacterium]|nr:(d)CMP kinase [Steroidobacteraceae bacterium]